MSRGGKKPDPVNLVGGIHAINSALEQNPGDILQLWLDRKRNDKRIQEIQQKAERLGMKIHPAEKAMLDELAGDIRHQGVVAEIKTPDALDEKALFSLLEKLDEPAFLLILDGVTDPHNLGACLRSADAAGVHAVITPKDRSVGLTPVAVKVASGAAATMPFVQVTNLARFMQKLQNDFGIWITGTAGEAEQSLYEADLKGNIALVMGSEGKGMRRLTRENCDSLVKLPMQGSVESLNVSVATGICLFEALRQRKASK